MGSGQMMPELGSRISLISKADIRYEGRLFTVDPQECTIALANVRSFGTEDRDTGYPIAPQPTIYDYILFRGSDIKDIRVVNNVAIPNDPAIMQMQMNQQPGFPPQQMQPGPMGGAQFAPFGNLQGPPPPMGQNIAPQQPNQQQNQAQSPQQAQPSHTTQSSPQQQPLSQQDSRSATPNQSRKSPTNDMAVQTSQRNNAENQGANKDKMQRMNMNNNNQHHQRNNNNNFQQYRERQEGRNEGYRNQRPPQQQNSFQNQPQRGGYNNNNKTRGGGSGRMPQMIRGPPHQNAPPHYQNFRQQQQQNNNNSNPQNRPNKPPNKTPLKFENEFDFEAANSQFEKMLSELTKMKVGSEENKNPEQQVNGEVEKKDDSGNDSSADHDQQEGDGYDGYDKTKSFFDNISCEANERSKGNTQRTDWRKERKINTVTFGLSNRRGMMRGRGGYYRNQYGRPMNNYRGGGSGGGQQYRNNNNNNNRRINPQQGGRTNNNINQGQQSQQQSTTAAAADK